MKKTLLLALSLIVFGMKAQLTTGSYKDYFKEGSYLFLEENYDVALVNFLKAYELDSSSANINYNVGVCYLKSPTQKNKAERFLTKAVAHVDSKYRIDDATEKNAPPLAYFYYAQALQINYHFDEAIANYNKFAPLVATDKEWTKDLIYYKKQSEYAKEQVAMPLPVLISSMGDSINSEYPDYSPVLSADERTMIFTTRRPNSTGQEKTPDGQFFEDIVVSYRDNEGRWSKPVSIGNNVNTTGHEASINLSPDGQTLIVFKDDGGNGNIYFTQWDGKTWGPLESFGSDINTKSWESHACLNADGTILYFVSDRPGGQGGRDIYRSVKLPNGKWSKSLNIGPTVNTPYDEEGAFIHPDGKTFFFASKGHRSMGGFDIMFSIIDEDNKFSEPFNMGHPINTPDDDVFYVTSPDGKRSYLSSAREFGLGEKDIYMVTIPEAKEKALALFKGQIIPADGEQLPEDIVIVVKDKVSGDIIGSYRPKIVNGTFSTILPPGKEYNFSYQANGQEFYNEDVFVSNELNYQEIKKEINLEPVKIAGKVTIKNKGILLNVIVLNNAKDKKPVANAKVTLTDKAGAVTTIDVDDKGRKEGTMLALDDAYTLFAEFNGKKSTTNSFNTKGIKGSKTFNEVLYVEEKAKTSAYALSLNVSVYSSSKTHKPLANANVILVGNNGSKVEVKTDDKGQVKGMSLESDVNYDLSASMNDISSDKTYFTTANTKANKTYNKTLYVQAAPVIEKLPPTKYEYYFSYNKNKNDDAAEAWINFIDRLVELSKKRNVSVSIVASASKVPTMIIFKDNKELAKSRAQIMQDKINEAVAAKGGDVSKLKFSKQSSVNGPGWHNDHVERRLIFEKYQFVKVTSK